MRRRLASSSASVREERGARDFVPPRLQSTVANRQRGGCPPRRRLGSRAPPPVFRRLAARLAIATLWRRLRSERSLPRSAAPRRAGPSSLTATVRATGRRHEVASPPRPDPAANHREPQARGDDRSLLLVRHSHERRRVEGGAAVISPRAPTDPVALWRGGGHTDERGAWDVGDRHCRPHSFALARDTHDGRPPVGRLCVEASRAAESGSARCPRLAHRAALACGTRRAGRRRGLADSRAHRLRRRAAILPLC